VTLPIIKAPTTIKTDPVANEGMLLSNGAKKMEMKNQKEVARAVRPVLPPSEIPEADSTKGVGGLVPNSKPDMAIQSESTMKAGELPSKSPSRMSKRPACLDMATRVPVVSRRST
jgi:hypothetical protein